MHILAGFYGSIANGSVYTTLPGVADSVLSLQNGNVYISGRKLKVLAAAVMGASVTAAQLQAPSLRTLAFPEIYPPIVAAAVPDRYALCLPGIYGPQVQMNENFGLNVSVGGGAPSDNFGALWLTPSYVNATPGPVTTIPFTATITAVKGAWTLGAMTPGTQLAVGRYAIVGMEVTAANTWLARIATPGDASSFRPGVVANTTYGRIPYTPYNRYGALGSFGEFDSTAIPALEIFGLAAGAAAPTVWLDLVKVR